MSIERLEELELARGGPFRFRLRGETYTVADPASVPFTTIYTLLHLRDIPGLPNMPLWKRAVVFRAWAAHYDLPPMKSAQRLGYVVNRYRDDLEYDLRIHAQVDLGQAWRDRRWRTLLATIDRLPPHCYYSEAVSQDPEHAKMLAEALASREGGEDGEPGGPPLRTWTPEVALLTEIKDAIRSLEYTTVAVQAGKKGAGEPPKPSPRPNSLAAQATRKAVFERRKSAHERLVARMLPHKSKAD